MSVYERMSENVRIILFKTFYHFTLKNVSLSTYTCTGFPFLFRPLKGGLMVLFVGLFVCLFCQSLFNFCFFLILTVRILRHASLLRV